MRGSVRLVAPSIAFALVAACSSTSSTPSTSASTEEDAAIDAPPIEAEDANVGDASINFACASDTDCPAGRRCAFLVTLACSAQGACVVPAPPSLFACACDGTDVPYVTPLTTSSPASSPSPCSDASTDASAGDASTE